MLPDDASSTGEPHDPVVCAMVSPPVVTPVPSVAPVALLAPEPPVPVPVAVRLALVALFGGGGGTGFAR